MFFRKVKGIVLGFCLFLVVTSQALATADYILPYPGLMPGHRLYQIKQVFDQCRRFWAFGSFSRYQYELGLADKKLVEAKVLLEYQQYLLGVKALTDSSQHFQKAKEYLVRAEEEGKDISQKLANLKAAAKKHSQVLVNLEKTLPKSFLWQPEKGPASELDLESTFKEAIAIREI